MWIWLDPLSLQAETGSPDSQSDSSTLPTPSSAGKRTQQEDFQLSARVRVDITATVSLIGLWGALFIADAICLFGRQFVCGKEAIKTSLT